MKAVSGSVRAATLVLLTALIVIRKPQLLLTPRLWAEEGTVWVATLFDSSFFESVTFVDKNNSYFDLAANLFTYLATRFPIEFWPWVTTYLSLLYLLVVFCVVLWNDGSLFAGTARKILCCLIVLFAPTHHEEVWLTSLHVKTYAGLCTLFIMADKPPSALGKVWLYRFLLLFNALSGPYSILIALPFFVAFLLDRRHSGERCAQMIIVLIGIALQVSSLIFSLLKFGIDHHRTVPISLADAATMALKWQLLDPVLGSTWAEQLLGGLGIPFPAVWPLAPGEFFVGSLVSIPIIFTIWSILVVAGSDSSQWTLAACWALMAGLTSIASLNHMPIGRYAVIPGVIVLLAMMNTVRFSTVTWTALWNMFKAHQFSKIVGITLTVLVCALIIHSLWCGALQYRKMPLNNYSRAPSWESEILKWRQNPNHKIRILPGGLWEMKIVKTGP